MADRKLMEDYENSVMSLAVSEMLEEYGKELIEKSKNMENLKPSEKAAAKFEAALNKEYRKGQIKQFKKSIAKAAKYVITACAALIIIFSISVVSVDALRFKFLDWLTNIHPTHTAYNDSLNNLYVPEKIPYGYTMQSYSRDDVTITESYSNSTDNIITIIIDLNSNVMMNVDNELSDSEIVEINGNMGVLYKKDGDISLTWNDSEKSYFIFVMMNMYLRKKLLMLHKL